MIKKVLNYIQSNRLLIGGEKIIVGVSGGADSVCLVHILARIRDMLRLQLYAVHVNHGLRAEEANADAVFTKELCEHLHLPCHLVLEDVQSLADSEKLTLEEAGRVARYRAFEEERKRQGATKIAVAHHGNDSAETILFQLFRGSGLKGVSGISPKRGQIIRPLLCCTRLEIEGYLKEQGLNYCTDKTNLTDDYTRNKIRNRLLPYILKEINSRAVENILHTSHLIAQAESYIDQSASTIFHEYVLLENGKVGILRDIMESQEPIIKTFLVRQMIEEAVGHLKDITATHIEDITGLLAKQVGSEIHLPYGYIGKVTYQHLWIEKESSEQIGEIGEDYSTPEITMTTFPLVRGMEIPKNQYTKWFDYDKIESTLSVRHRQTGDFITLASGGRKNVKAFMIDEKIPKEDRDRILLLADGNHILWIVGYRISEYYKVTDDTATILQIEFHGGSSDGR